MSIEEKRKFTRVKYFCDVLVSLPSDEFDEEFTIISANSVNLSAGGILFKYPELIKQDTELSLAFFPPHTQSVINIKGKVVRVKKEGDYYLIALEFIRFINGNQEELNSLLET